MTMSPAFTWSAACCTVWNGCRLSPAFPSLPADASTHQHLPPPLGAHPDGGGATPTSTMAFPLFPSDVAVIETVPALIPVTSPLALTVAMVWSPLDHVTTRPVRMLPFASFVVAASWTVWPGWTAADDGVTATVATGTWVTVMLEVPLWLSLVAVIVADPAAFADTRPVPFTVATVVLLEDHVTVRPDSGLPFASFGVAVSCTVWPACTLAYGAAFGTAAAATTWVAALAVPLRRPPLAVIVAAPLADPAVTSPVPFTVATVVLFEDHVTTRPDSGLPFASFVVAVSCAVWPLWRATVAGATVTDATGTLETAMLADALWPSLVAVMLAEPVPAAVTRPVPLTPATDPLSDDQVMVRPVRTLPPESVRVAWSWTVPPTTSVADEGARLTVATGASVIITVALSDGPPGSAVATTLYGPVVCPALY